MKSHNYKWADVPRCKMKPPTVFNFYTTCVEVAFLTSDQVGQKWDFELPTNLVGSLFYSRQVVGKLILEILSNLGRIIFLQFFLESVLKMSFSSATIWKDIFCDHSPNDQFYRLPLGEVFWKIAAKARIKNSFSSATIWERLWTKSISHRLPRGR